MVDRRVPVTPQEVVAAQTLARLDSISGIKSDSATLEIGGAEPLDFQLDLSKFLPPRQPQVETPSLLEQIQKFQDEPDASQSLFVVDQRSEPGLGALGRHAAGGTFEISTFFTAPTPKFPKLQPDVIIRPGDESQEAFEGPMDRIYKRVSLTQPEEGYALVKRSKFSRLVDDALEGLPSAEELTGYKPIQVQGPRNLPIPAIEFTVGYPSGLDAEAPVPRFAQPTFKIRGDGFTEPDQPKKRRGLLDLFRGD